MLRIWSEQLYFLYFFTKHSSKDVKNYNHTQETKPLYLLQKVKEMESILLFGFIKAVVSLISYGTIETMLRIVMMIFEFIQNIVLIMYISNIYH